MKPILRRIQDLERRLPPPVPAPSGPPVREVIADALARAGFARGENESLAETLARYLGITVRELRRLLERLAARQPWELPSDIGG
jgi:hypothetical protein